MAGLSRCAVLVLIIHVMACNGQSDDYFPDPLDFLSAWIKNDNPPFYLNEKQAAWWYSLGSYKPRKSDKEPLNYPQRVYPGKPPINLPPIGGQKSTLLTDFDFDETSCEMIPEPMRTRREFREMTEAMRNNFVSAVNALAQYCPDNCIPCNSASCTSSYKMFVGLHQVTQSPAAHGGAAFLPFHREFLWRFENALILHGGYPEDQGVPIWDTILDSSLPNPRDSVMFSPAFMGNPVGVLQAPFAGISVPNTCSGQINRDVRNNAAVMLFHEQDVSDMMNHTCFADLTDTTGFTCPGGGACNFETRHGGPHMWVRGDMANFCSPSDPIFWLHHGFMDCLWEDFRQNAQRSHLEKEYPQNSTDGTPFAWDAPMAPFEGLINAHGLSTHYTTYYYQCANRTSANQCSVDNDCNKLSDANPALWCDGGYCRSKIRWNGQCVRNGSNLPDNACWCLNAQRIPNCNVRCECLTSK